jgi:hypothetical protein
MSTPLQLVAEGRQQLERRLEVGQKGGLASHPGLGMGKRLEHATSSASRTLDDASVDQEQEQARSLVEWRRRPELGIGQIILEVQTCVTDGFFKQGHAMLVVTVKAVVSDPADPIARQLINK